MSNRGRKKHYDPPVTWKLNIPLSLAAEIELRLVDPLTGRVKKGKRSEIAQQLFRAWLQEQKENDNGQ
jgi:hypothetical protein